MELIRAQPASRSRNLVFTSAGDRSNVHLWLKGRRDFDLWVAYYGEQPGTLLPLSDLYLARRGTKFQNLHYCYSRWRELIAQYDAVMVIDDDILINGSSLTRLFEIRGE